LQAWIATPNLLFTALALVFLALASFDAEITRPFASVTGGDFFIGFS
jgi:hypothetical protein